MSVPASQLLASQYNMITLHITSDFHTQASFNLQFCSKLCQTMELREDVKRERERERETREAALLEISTSLEDWRREIFTRVHLNRKRYKHSHGSHIHIQQHQFHLTEPEVDCNPSNGHVNHRAPSFKFAVCRSAVA